MKLSTFSIKPLYNFLLEKDYHLFGCGGPVIATTRFFPRRYYLVYGKGIGAAYKKGDLASYNRLKKTTLLEDAEFSTVWETLIKRKVDIPDEIREAYKTFQDFSDTIKSKFSDALKKIQEEYKYMDDVFNPSIASVLFDYHWILTSMLQCEAPEWMRTLDIYNADIEEFASFLYEYIIPLCEKGLSMDEMQPVYYKVLRMYCRLLQYTDVFET